MIFIKEKSMKNLFEISEEEKNNIRGLHESHKDKPGTSLNEQLKVKGGKFNVGFNKTEKTKSISQSSFELEPEFQKNPQFAKQWLNNEAYMGGSDAGGKNLIEKIWLPKMNDESKTNFKSMVEQEPVFTASLVYLFDPSEYKKIIVTKKNITTVIPGQDTPPNVIPIEIKFPLRVPPTTEFFKDNRSEPTIKFQSEVDSIGGILISQLKDIKTYGENLNPVFVISDISFESSASRFKNKPYEVKTKNADGFDENTMVDPGTWCDLSQARADKAINVLKNSLKNYLGDNITFDFAKENINTKGQNGDCTSGPDPYVEGQKLVKSNPKQYPDLRTVFFDENFRKDYEPYKYVKMSITYFVDPATLKIIVPGAEGVDETLKSSLYKLTFSRTDWNFDFDIDLPSIVRVPNVSKPPFGGIFTKSEQPCPTTIWQRFKNTLKGKPNPKTMNTNF
jgi:hypothetical protein